MTRRRRDVSERFWEKVNKTDTCWLWTGAPHGPDTGCGVFQLGRGEGEGLIGAPHFAWIEAGNEPPPPGYFLCHHCDTPKCVRPDHLFVGTPKDNSQDMSQKGRARAQKITHCPQNHPYDEENTVIQPTTGARHCRICIKERRRKRYLRETGKTALQTHEERSEASRRGWAARRESA